MTKQWHINCVFVGIRGVKLTVWKIDDRSLTKINQLGLRKYQFPVSKTAWTSNFPNEFFQTNFSSMLYFGWVLVQNTREISTYSPKYRLGMVYFIEKYLSRLQGNIALNAWIFNFFNFWDHIRFNWTLFKTSNHSTANITFLLLSVIHLYFKIDLIFWLYTGKHSCYVTALSKCEEMSAIIVKIQSKLR